MRDLEKGVAQQVRVERIAPVSPGLGGESVGFDQDKLFDFAQIRLCRAPGPFSCTAGVVRSARGEGCGSTL